MSDARLRVIEVMLRTYDLRATADIAREVAIEFGQMAAEITRLRAQVAAMTLPKGWVWELPVVVEVDGEAPARTTLEAFFGMHPEINAEQRVRYAERLAVSGVFSGGGAGSSCWTIKTRPRERVVLHEKHIEFAKDGPT